MHLSPASLAHTSSTTGLYHPQCRQHLNDLLAIMPSVLYSKPMVESVASRAARIEEIGQRYQGHCLVAVLCRLRVSRFICGVCQLCRQEQQCVNYFLHNAGDVEYSPQSIKGCLHVKPVAEALQWSWHILARLPQTLQCQTYQNHTSTCKLACATLC